MAKILSLLLVTSLLAATPAVAQQPEEDESVPEFGPESETQEAAAESAESAESADRARDRARASASASDSDSDSDDDGGPDAAPQDDAKTVTAETTVADSALSLDGDRPSGASPKVKLGSSSHLQFFGYLRLVGSYVTDDPEVIYVGRNDGFTLQNARIGVDGVFGKYLAFRVSADGANDERNSPNEVEGTLRFVLKDAFADLKLLEALELRAGRFNAIFDIDNFTSAAERAFVRRALSSRGTSATEGFQTSGLGVRRNLGIALRSPSAVKLTDRVHLGYELAAQNGNAEFAAANDNDSLAYSGALFLRVSNKALAFVAGRYNRRTEGELPLRITEDDIAGSVGLRVKVSSLRLTGQLMLVRTEFPTTGGPVENAYGGHLEAVLAIPGIDALEAGYRFSILDESDLMPANAVQEHTGGVNIALPQVNMRLQLNYTHTLEQEGRQLTNDRVEALAEVRL